MADPKIFIRRSATPNKVPTVDQLALGELAINTYDGKLYLEQDQGSVGVGTTIVAVNPWSVGVGSTAYNIYFTSGSVGIGTTNPTSKLHVIGDTLIIGIATADSFRGDGSQLTGITAAGSLSISTNTTNSNLLIPYATSFGSTTGLGATSLLVYNPSTGNLGIGTTIPTSKLHVIGDVNISGVITATTATLSTIGLSAADITSSSTTTTTITATSIASVSATVYRSAVFQVQSVQGTNYNMTTINVLHDGIETYMTEYGTINQPIEIATFSTDINDGSLRLLAYPASINSTTFKVLTKALYI